MQPLTNEHYKPEFFFKWREEVLKKQPMSKLEKSMEKFFIDNNINYHRQFPIRFGKKHPKRFAVSFWCSKHHLIFDLYDEGDDMSVYDPDRKFTILFKPHNPKVTIIPIPSNMAWREVKKQLKIFFGL